MDISQVAERNVGAETGVSELTGRLTDSTTNEQFGLSGLGKSEQSALEQSPQTSRALPNVQFDYTSQFNRPTKLAAVPEGEKLYRDKNVGVVSPDELKGKLGAAVKGFTSPTFEEFQSKQKPEVAPLYQWVGDKERKDIATFAAAAKAAPAKPVESLSMVPRFLTWGWTFDVTGANGKSDGVVDQKLLNFTKTFEYSDASGKKLATGSERFLTWGVKVDVTDEKGTPIGGIQEQVFKSLWKPYTIYSVVDAAGKEIAKSEKVEFLATDFTLKNPQGETIAKIHRPWLNWLRDNWTIDIYKPSEVDKRILYMIPAYKTSTDYERKQKKNND